mgnify:CR=1 FL=1
MPEEPKEVNPDEVTPVTEPTETPTSDIPEPTTVEPKAE